MDCLPGHVIAVQSHGSKTYLNIWDINAWPSSDWSYESDEILHNWTQNMRQNWTVLPKTPLVTMPMKFDLPVQSATLSTYRSPLYPNQYTIWTNAISGHVHHIITKHRFIPNSTTPEIQLVFSRRFQRRDYSLSDAISFSGHAVVRSEWNATGAKFSVISCNQPNINPLDAIPFFSPSSQDDSCIDISSDGVAVVIRDTGIFICYYE